MIIASILKKCLNGLLYVLTLPIVLIALAIFGTLGIIIFVFVGIKAIFYFFTGRNLFGDFPEDIRAKEIMSGTAVTSVEIHNEPVQQKQEETENKNLYITQPDSDEINTTVIETFDDNINGDNNGDNND